MRCKDTDLDGKDAGRSNSIKSVMSLLPPKIGFLSPLPYNYCWLTLPYTNRLKFTNMETTNNVTLTAEPNKQEPAISNAQKITPFLWFNDQAEEAMNFYTSIFKNSKIGRISRYGDAGPGPKGSVMSATFQLDGVEFYALNGGPYYSLTPAISFFVNCKDQEEVDFLWDKLSTGGKIMQCGWVTDKFGVTWQIIPTILGQLLNDPDPEKSKRVMQAMMKMIKIDIKGLQQAYEG